MYAYFDVDENKLLAYQKLIERYPKVSNYDEVILRHPQKLKAE